jgi:hypothetical protein
MLVGLVEAITCRECRIVRTAATSRPRPHRVGVKARLSHGSIKREESSQCHDRLAGLRGWANEACMLCRH